MFILCSTFVILPENNGDNLLPSMRVTAVSTPSSTNDAGKYLSPILPNTRFRKRSIYEFLLTFQSQYSAMKKSSISSFPNSLVDGGGRGMAYACKPLGSWAASRPYGWRSMERAT